VKRGILRFVMKAKTQKKLEEGTLIRILATDIPGGMPIYSGLSRIKGVSWSFSNAICRVLGMDKEKKVENLIEEEIKNLKEKLEGEGIMFNENFVNLDHYQLKN